MLKINKPSEKNRNIYKRLIIAGIIIILLLSFFYYENNHLVLTSYAVSSDKLSASFNDYKIIHISDLHDASFGKNNIKLIKLIKAQDPDIIVITGDMVDSKNSNINKVIDLYKELSNISEIYYVTGNHEYWLEDNDLQTLFSELQKIGIHILNNEGVKVSSTDNCSYINLYGLNDKDLSDNTINNLAITEDSYNILLAHEPQYFDKYASANADLILAGHAHGGQFNIPFIGPIIAPDQGFFPKYAMGEYSQNNSTMIVNRGLGNSVIPVRLFNDPEIVSIVLHGTKQENDFYETEAIDYSDS